MRHLLINWKSDGRVGVVFTGVSVAWVLYANHRAFKANTFQRRFSIEV